VLKFMYSDGALGCALSPERLVIWQHLESEKIDRMKDVSIGKELTRSVMPFVNKSFAKFVRSLPSDKSIDLDENGFRLFDYAQVTEEVLVGRVPRNVEDIKFLHGRESVHAVVSLSEDWELHELGWPAGMVASAGMSWIHLPTPVVTALTFNARTSKLIGVKKQDYSSPNMCDLITAVQVLQLLFEPNASMAANANATDACERPFSVHPRAHD
jgi:hypothetical protein